MVTQYKFMDKERIVCTIGYRTLPRKEFFSCLSHALQIIHDLKHAGVNYPFAQGKWASGFTACALVLTSDFSPPSYWTVPDLNFETFFDHFFTRIYISVVYCTTGVTSPFSI